MDQKESDENQKNETDRQDRPRIYIASLADYNAGWQHGKWIDADQQIQDICREIDELLKESGQPVAEEWAIHDYQNFGDLTLSEFEDLEKVAEAARLIREYGKVFAGMAEHVGGLDSLDEAKRYMEDGYRGAWDSLAHYAEQLVEDCYGDTLAAIPNFIRYHIDYAGIGRDMELGGDVFTVECEGQIHVFESNI
jgi:antirestriction protein